MNCHICATPITEQTAHSPRQLGDSELCCCPDCADKLYQTRPCSYLMTERDAERFINVLDETTVGDVFKRFSPWH